MTDRLQQWEQATLRAQQISGSQGGMPFDPGSWDDQAQARIIAVTLYARFLRDGDDPATADLGRALWLLANQARWEAIAGQALHDAGHLPAVEGDPVAEVWMWLHQTWNPDAPAGQRWDGLTRGIARGLTSNAIDVCLSPWAFGAVDRAIVAERSGFAHHSRVRGSTAELEDLIGRIEHSAWDADDEHETIHPGSPTAYWVTFSGLPPRVFPAALLTEADPAGIPPMPVVVLLGPED